MNGSEVGRWQNGPGEPSFCYDESWVHAETGRPLSLSLPFRSDNAPYKGQIVHVFFDNLLPDSDAIRRRLAQHHRAHSADPFGLLAVLGRDCVGAIQLLPPDETPTGLDLIEGDPLSEADIAHILKATVSGTPLGHHHETVDIRRRHWYIHATAVKQDKKVVDEIIEELIATTDSAIETAASVLPPRFPYHIAESLFEGLRTQRDKLAQQESKLA
jgi:HipA-like protein